MEEKVLNFIFPGDKLKLYLGNGSINYIEKFIKSDNFRGINFFKKLKDYVTIERFDEECIELSVESVIYLGNKRYLIKLISPLCNSAVYPDFNCFLHINLNNYKIINEFFSIWLSGVFIENIKINNISIIGRSTIYKREDSCKFCSFSKICNENKTDCSFISSNKEKDRLLLGDIIVLKDNTLKYKYEAIVHGIYTYNNCIDEGLIFKESNYLFALDRLRLKCNDNWFYFSNLFQQTTSCIEDGRITLLKKLSVSILKNPCDLCFLTEDNCIKCKFSNIKNSINYE